MRILVSWSDKELPVQEPRRNLHFKPMLYKIMLNQKHFSTKFPPNSSPEPDIEVKVELGDDKLESFGDKGNEENGDFEEAYFSDQGN